MFSINTNDVQSVKDQRLSERRTKSFQAAAKTGGSILTRRRFFDSRIARPAAEARSIVSEANAFARSARFWRANSARAATASPWERRRPKLFSRISAAFRTVSFCSGERRRVVILYTCIRINAYYLSAKVRDLKLVFLCGKASDSREGLVPSEKPLARRGTQRQSGSLRPSVPLRISARPRFPEHGCVPLRWVFAQENNEQRRLYPDQSTRFRRRPSSRRTFAFESRSPALRKER